MDAPDYFQFFGLDARLSLDLADLESRFTGSAGNSTRTVTRGPPRPSVSARSKPPPS